MNRYVDMFEAMADGDVRWCGNCRYRTRQPDDGRCRRCRFSNRWKKLTWWQKRRERGVKVL